MKVIVAGVNDNNRSYVELRQELGDTTRIGIWTESVTNVHAIIDRLDPATFMDGVAPLAGEFRLVYHCTMPSGAGEGEHQVGHAMHSTPSLDFDYVLAGRMQCVLDEEVVDLEAGDMMILKAAAHSWHNPGDVPCAMLYLIHAPVALPV